jgi:hypothetical protein
MSLCRRLVRITLREIGNFNLNNMEAVVNTLDMPVGEDICKTLYTVEIKVFDMGAFGGFGMSRMKTFGVYKSKEVANFIADCIRNGKIIV